MNGIGSSTSYIVLCVYPKLWVRYMAGKVDEWMSGLWDIGIGRNVLRGENNSNNAFLFQTLVVL